MDGERLNGLWLAMELDNEFCFFKSKFFFVESNVFFSLAGFVFKMIFSILFPILHNDT